MSPPLDPAVDAWFEKKKHPQTAAMQAVRRAILDSDERVTECVKWQSPTFVYKGNLASIMPGAKRFVSLMFHRGASIPGNHPELQGGGDVGRYMRFESVEDVAAKREALRAAVRAWCDARDSER